MADETPDELEQSEPQTKHREEMVLQFDPPYPLFAIKVDTEKQEEVIVQEPLKKHELTNRMRVAIPNPFKPEEERFLPGIAYGNGIEFVMEIGQSFGSLGFHEDFGWYCQAMIPKSHVMARMVEDMLKKSQQKQEGSFTERLVKKSSKKTE